MGVVGCLEAAADDGDDDAKRRGEDSRMKTTEPMLVQGFVCAIERFIDTNETLRMDEGRLMLYQANLETINGNKSS